MLPPPFTCYWPEESPVTQPCHLVELWRFNSLLVNRNLPHNYHPHLGRCLPCNISQISLAAEDNTTLSIFARYWTSVGEGRCRSSSVSWMFLQVTLPISGSQKKKFSDWHVCDVQPLIHGFVLELTVPQSKRQVSSNKRQIEPHRRSHTP